MLKGVMFGLLFLCFLAGSVYALEDVETRQLAYKDTIFQGGDAEFYITINNNQEFEDTFRFVKPFVYWSWDMEAEAVNVVQGNSEKVLVKLTPSANKDPGDYGVMLNIVSRTDDDVRSEEFLEIKIVSFEQVLNTNVELPDSINPNKEHLFRVNLDNTYDISLEDVVLVLESDYFEKELNFSIKPHGEIDLEFPVSFEGTVNEGENPLFLRFYSNDNLIYEFEETMHIGYFTEVSGVGAPEDGFLYDKETLVRTNTGNVVSHEVYTKGISWFTKYFTTTNPDPDVISKQDGGYLYTWSFDLEPDESKTIVIETSYRAFVFWLIVAILVIAFLIYWFRRDLSLNKKIVSVKKGEHGYYILNVMLTLKNKTLKNIKNVKVMDRLGGRVESATPYGLYNSNIYKSDSGKSTKIIWSIPNVGKRENIVLRYTMKYKPYIIKSVPPAVAKYLRHGKAVHVKSKRADIF
jgi:hypothetical protein